MILKEMREDFYFVLPDKKDAYIEVKADKALIEKIERLMQDYCFFIEVLDQGKVVFGSILNYLYEYYFNNYNYDIPRKVLNSLHEQIYKKTLLYRKIKNYHNKLITINKKRYTICVSLGMDEISHNESYATFAKEYKKVLSRFFNNLRSHAFYQDFVIGYFWVLLKKKSNNCCYAHVNFYLKDCHFNQKLVREINGIWRKVIKSENRTGEVLYFTMKENINPAEQYESIGDSTTRRKIKKKYEKVVSIASMKNDKTLIVYPDFNEGNENYEYYFNNDNKKEFFENYLISLAKKSFYIPNFRGYGMASVEMAKNKLKKDKEKNKSKKS
ncbi:hypothetical protein AB7X34_20205 [Proteus mirabilis]|uniref:hypothetical protein n=1 Tax=Proteus TaxID=583 RepID=UPI001EFB85B1|nr:MULTISPECIES: hypothetical protein [Proteus]MCI9740561.1 hypothetical protein [Proteus mirabilis]MCI9753871.1 hypothetical protein [Proteus mirabilis]MCI9765168.1 hypothetical protein [Proteus mirabilis]MCI9780124.1 hypothetical protein [Proteus mirabilis]MCI9783350.1 hypothetical protein [Proteus mirabilis]